MADLLWMDTDNFPRKFNTSKDLGKNLGIVANRHDAYTPKEKGKAAAEIVFAIRQLEEKIVNLTTEVERLKNG